MGDSDELFDVRNTFLLSAFQQCIAEAAKVKVFPGLFQQIGN